MAKHGVDGVYPDDPRTNPEARRYRQVNHQDAIERNLRVMDTAALSLCRENGLPILVFDMSADASIFAAVTGSAVGTLVSSGETIFDEVVVAVVTESESPQ
jgi:uridylate kinase